MPKKLTRHGNSYALVIDRPTMELLNIGPDTELEVSTDGKVMIVAPIKDAKRRKKFEEALKEVNRKYGKALKRLAE